MMRHFTVIAALAILPPSALASEIRALDWNNWRIGAYTDPGTRQFYSCIAGANYRTGIRLMFRIDSEMNWFVTLTKPNWNLPVGVRRDLT